jgi:fluoroquinolone resistance protein
MTGQLIRAIIHLHILRDGRLNPKQESHHTNFTRETMNSIINAQEYYDQTFEKIHLEQDEILSGKFTDCVFVKSSFEAAILSNCRFSSCIFQECNLSLAQLTGSSFPSTRFDRSKLIGVNWTQADWSTSGIRNLVGFFDCVISHSTFIGLELKSIQIKNCTANDVDFREADLSNADFKGTDLARSIFGNTNLTEADLSLARNYMIDPRKNVLKQAKFSIPEAMALLYSMDIILRDQNDPA